MKTIRYSVVLLLVMSSLLIACGQKGPLYMPDPVPQQKQEQDQKQDQEQEQEKKTEQH
jgi:predicted small lipoprotein YifL